MAESSPFHIVFDVYHLYHLPQFEPVIELLSSDDRFNVTLTVSAEIKKPEYELIQKILKAKTNKSKWPELVNEYEALNALSNEIRKLKPILKINIGYQLNLPFQDYTYYLNEAKPLAADYHYMKALKYKPDLTVVAFCWCNDVGNNIDKLKSGDMNPLLDEYYVGWFKRLQVKRKNFNKWLWNNSGLYQFTRTKYNHLEHYFKRMFLPDYMKKVHAAADKKRLERGQLQKGLMFDPKNKMWIKQLKVSSLIPKF